MSTTPRSAPPQLAGFDNPVFLGGGGFADVFLYNQRRPAREVAVKVLRSEAVGDAARADFDAEVDLMARVSAHPHIVTIYEAGIASDGRPFLVMEYYRRDHYGARSRTGLSVAEVLRVGVQVASAVETLHRFDIVHRDIKPANILVSEYGKPGLTDFGIAGARGSEETKGASLSFAAPEVLLGRSAGDAASDVYSLGATLYSLLAGRAPFEGSSSATDRASLVQAALTAPVPTLPRSDVPRSLINLITQAMSRDPAHRPAGAAELARGLQSVERELRLDVTPLETPQDESASRPRMRIELDPPSAPAPGRPLSSPQRPAARPASEPAAPIAAAPAAPGAPGTPAAPPVPGGDRQPAPAPAPTPAGPPAQPPPGAAAESDATITNMPVRVNAPSTERRLPSMVSAPATREDGEPEPARERKIPVGVFIGGGAAVLTAVVAGVVLISSGHSHHEPAPTVTNNSDPDPAINSYAPPPAPVTGVTLTRAGTTITISWTNGVPPPAMVAINRVDQAGAGIVIPPAKTSPAVVTGIDPTTTACFQLRSIGSGSELSSPTPEVCTP